MYLTNFRNKCMEIYELDHAHFLSAPGLAWPVCLKKADVRLELLTDINMLLMVEIGIRDGICHAIHRYAKANNKCMKNYDKNKEYLMYLGANNLYVWAMPKNCVQMVLNGKKNMLKFNENFKKTMMRIVIKDIFLK